ncbi:hypothetical protein T265_14264, partial [Opisthorchis viverrini]
RLKHEAAWCSTFSCLRTSQTRDSAGFQNLPLFNFASYMKLADHQVSMGVGGRRAVPSVVVADNYSTIVVGLFAEPGNLIANVSSPIEVTSSVRYWRAWRCVALPNNALIMSPRLVMKRLQSAQRTSQRPSTLPSSIELLNHI